MATGERSDLGQPPPPDGGPGGGAQASAASIPGLPAAPAPSSHRVSEPYEYLRLETEGPVARITLNRPQVRNALSLALSDELIHALERLRDTDTVKVVVLQGAGGTFCAGDDITEMPRWGNANGVMRRVHGYQHMANTLEELDKLTIARVDGYAVGGGLELTM